MPLDLGFIFDIINRSVYVRESPEDIRCIGK